MKIFFDHELSVTRYQEAVDLRRVDRIHRHVTQHLNELLYAAARDADVLGRGYRPAITQIERFAVFIALCGFASRVERAG